METRQQPMWSLVVGVGSIIALMFALLYMIYVHTETVLVNQRALFDIKEKTELAYKMREAIRQRSFSIAMAQTMDDYFDRDAEGRRFQAFASDFIVARERLMTLGISTDEQTILSDFQNMVRVRRPFVDGAMDAVIEGLQSPEYQKIIRRATSSQAEQFKVLSRFVDLQKQREISHLEQAAQNSTSEQKMMILLGSMALLFATAIAFSIIRRERWHTAVLEGRVDDRTRELNKEVAVRAKAEERLSQTEIRHGVTIATVPSGIVTINEKGIIETFNPAAERIFGYTEAEACGSNVNILMPEPYAGDHDGYIANYLSTGKRKIIGLDRDVIGRRKDGSEFPIHLAVDRMTIGTQINFVGVIEDITERKQVENQLREARDQAEIANDAKSNFLGSISHELRTPMNAILGFSQMLGINSNDELTPKQAEYIYDILRSGEHLMDLINQVLEFSTIDTGNLELKCDAVDPSEIINDCLKMIETRAAGQLITIIKNHAQSEPCRVIADSMRLRQVLLNLLSNSIKYNRPGGSVTIDLGCRDAGTVRISITDTGDGVSPEQIEELFQPFNRLGKEAGQIEGIGIGLSIAKNLIEMMDGRIGCDSEPGKGSTFWIELPQDKN